MPSINFDSLFFTADLTFEDIPGGPRRVVMSVDEADTESESDTDPDNAECVCGYKRGHHDWKNDTQPNLPLACQRFVKRQKEKRAKLEKAGNEVVPSSVHEDGEVEPPAAEQATRPSSSAKGNAKRIRDWNQDVAEANDSRESLKKKRKVFLNLKGTGKDLNIRLAGKDGIQFDIII
ncbi:hypothetical protein CVT24_013311 [Panaeolus cyanescens]|uniref:Uncharacterized protein n=1 Tax=Panaeolus cyanescens TaxID=181874 RepID=A0A409YMC5_9AGAR|nr:hypothetical protein CVT24_013311 [Panaeolus cyanescens]